MGEPVRADAGRRWGGAGTLMLLAGALLAGPVVAQDRSCDLSFDVPSGDAGYRQRPGGRCEGVYIRPVSASTRLIVRGFHVGAPRFALPRDSVVTVEVLGDDAPMGSGSLIARSLRPRHYYQMDTRSVGPDGRYRWATGILAHPDVALEPRELGVLFAADDGSGALELWPTRVSGGDANDTPRVPVLIVEPETELVQILRRVTDADGTVVEEGPLPRRGFPADQAVRIRLDVPGPGVYSVLLIGVGSGDARGRTELTVHVPASALEGGGP